MAAHRYWRLYCRRNSGDGSWTGLSELELRTSVSGADQTGSGTAAASASIQSGSAAGVFDNNTGTGIQWAGTGGGRWVSYDFGVGNDKDIIEINILPKHDGASRTFGDFEVQYSDDNSNWTKAWSVLRKTWTIGVTQTFTKPSAVASARYWRVRFLGTLYGSDVISISEFQMRAAFGGADTQSGGTQLSFMTNPANALDADTATYCTISDVIAGYLGYDYGAANDKEIKEIALRPRWSATSTVYKQWPTSLVVENSVDEINWLTVWTVDQPLNTYSDGLCVLRNPASITPGSTHQWWGIRPTALQSSTSFGVREIEFRATPGGADLTTGGVGGSWRPFGNPGISATYVFDSAATDYASEGGQGLNDIVVYDYGYGNEKGPPAQLAVTARNDTGAANEYDQAPTAFDLVYSDDGHTFTTYESFTTTADWTSTETRLFGVTLPASGRRRQIVN